MSIFEKHETTIDKAVEALHQRVFYAQYPEHPSPKVYGETADADGRKAFQALLGKPYEALKQEPTNGWVGVEESPYLQEPLNITYPSIDENTLIERSEKAFHQWRKVNYKERSALLVESLERMKSKFFDIAYATMHTTGQGYMMAFQASGPHAADRALEAIAAGYEEQGRYPENTLWDKPMGKYNIQLNKSWSAVPKGVSLVIGCSTFPTWNSVPGVYASLVTGNSVIMKPHPGAVLPIAMVVAEIRKVLSENGYDPEICQLGVDTFENTITKQLAENDKVKVIDFTGNSEFGSYLEGLKGKAVFTEKTGVNSVILDSVENIDKVAANLAFSVALYSGQMCTAPQNFFIPESGIKTPEGNVSVAEFGEKMIEQINGLVDNPKAGPFVLGTIQNKLTLGRIKEAEKLSGKLLLASRSIENPMFKNARTATPVLMQVSAEDKSAYSTELFGPIALLITTKNTEESLALAKEMATEYGALSCGAYATDETTKDTIADEMALAAAPVSFNLTGGIYLNQHASFSDFHVTGGNPAGNASFTNPDYVNRRFTWVGRREPVKR